MADTDTGGNPFLDRAYALQGADDARELYDEWAATFDADLTGETQGYVGPQRTADAVVREGGIEGTILDAGAGTGLVGVALRERGAHTIDGVDISPGMLRLARATGAYRTLLTADLGRRLPLDDAAYDTAVCVGTFTHGHVGPEGFGELLRVLRPGGLFVATVLDDIWEPNGYAAETAALADRGEATVVSTELADYRAGRGVSARMVILRRTVSSG